MQTNRFPRSTIGSPSWRSSASTSTPTAGSSTRESGSPAVEPRPGGFSFAPGALEGILGHHTTPEPPTTDWSVEVARMVASALADPSPPRPAELYEHLREGQGTIIVEALAEALAKAGVPTAGTARVGTWLATTAPDPKPVSLGILLLGTAGAPDSDLLLDLGAHPAFTPDRARCFQRIPGHRRVSSHRNCPVAIADAAFACW